jgi:hypothetical protein
MRMVGNPEVTSYEYPIGDGKFAHSEIDRINCASKHTVFNGLIEPLPRGKRIGL